jgi:hypothetical protein
MTIRLTNADMDSASPFAGILIGQPTLARQLRMAPSPPWCSTLAFMLWELSVAEQEVRGSRCPPVPVFL